MIASFDKKPGLFARELFLAVGAAALGAAAVAALFHHRISDGVALRYFDTRLPMLTEADGYFHLYKAQELLGGRLELGQAPALSILGALVHKATGFPLELVAFWLPVALGLLCCCWPWAWGRLLGASRLECALAVLAASVVPIWVARSGPGWFDTDPGIALFMHGCLYATARAGLAPERPRAQHVLLFVISAALLAWWWRPGTGVAPLCVLLWGATYFLSEGIAWRRARLLAAGAVALLVVLALLLPDALLPGWFVLERKYFLAHESLVTGTASDLAFLSIDELKRLSSGEILDALGGSAAAGALGLAGLAGLCVRRPRRMLFLAPLAATVFASHWAQRLLFMAALPVALGVGLLPGTLAWLADRPRLSRLLASARLRTAAALVLVAVFLASSLHHGATSPLDLYFQEPQDRLALTIKQMAPAEAKVWNWWDDGYFLAARSGHAPLFDGGSQTPLMCHLAARPMVTEDPVFARRWMRFFALRGGEAAMGPLRAAWGGDDAALHNLEAVFSAADPRAALAKLPPLPSGAELLFPEGRVFLYLPQRFLKISRWWMAMGSTLRSRPDMLETHVETFKRTEFRYNPQTRQVTLPPEVAARGYKDFGAVFLTSRTPLAPPWDDGKLAPFVVTSELSPWLYVTDGKILGTVGFRLLAPGGLQLPGFAPVLVNYAFGGVWEILP